MIFSPVCDFFIMITCSWSSGSPLPVQQSNTKLFSIVYYIKVNYFCSSNYLASLISDVSMYYKCFHCNRLLKGPETNLMFHCEHCPKVPRPNSKFRYVCFICDYHSYQKQHMRIHIRRHTGEKPHACSKCDYKCTKSSDLTRHFKSLHSVTMVGLRELITINST